MSPGTPSPVSAGASASIPVLATVAVTLLGGSLAGSVLVAVAASAALAIGWKAGRGAGLMAGIALGVFALLADPSLARPLGGAVILGAVMAPAAAGFLPSVLMQGWAAAPQVHRDPPAPRLEDVLPPMAPQELPVVPQHPERRVPARRSLVQERDDSEVRTEQDVIERFLRDIRDAVGVDEAVFWRFEQGDQQLGAAATSAASREESQCFANPSYLELVRWATGERLIATGDDASPGLFLTGPVGKGDSFHGALGLFAADRTRIGRDRVKPWVGRYASHLALLIELLEESRSARRYRRRNQEVMEAVQRIQNQLELADLGPAICESAMQIASASRAAFVLWNAEAREGTLYAVSPGHPLPAGSRVDDDSLVGNSCIEQQRFAIREAFRMAAEKRIYGASEPRRKVGSLGIVPISRGREVLGAIVVEGDATAQVTAVEVDKLMLIAMAASIAVVNTEQYAAISERARRDELTGLRNRRSFDERLGQLLMESDRFGQPAALVLIDMDHFKVVNDTEGHEAGDAVLREVAQILNQTVRTVDLCARYGGEELAVLLPQTGLAAGTEVAERIRQKIEAAVVRIGGREIRVTASLGVAAYPESTQRGELLFRLADRALYEAKSAGRNRVRRAVLSQPAAKA